MQFESAELEFAQHEDPPVRICRQVTRSDRRASDLRGSQHPVSEKLLSREPARLKRTSMNLPLDCPATRILPSLWIAIAILALATARIRIS